MSPKPVGNVVFKQLRAARLGLERIGPTLCKLGGQTKVPGTWENSTGNTNQSRRAPINSSLDISDLPSISSSFARS